MDDSSLPQGSVLPRSQKALAQARRVLDQLPTKESSVEEYRDFLPWVLDRLDNVWRTIDFESKGHRTHEFGAWWAEQRVGNRYAVKVLRNAELKGGQHSARLQAIYRVPGFLRVHEDGTKSVHDAIGNELPEGTDIDGSALIEHSRRWEFTVPGIDGQQVQEVLERVYTRLAVETLPTAESLLSERKRP